MAVCWCSIGSLGKDSQEDGVQNVTVKTVTFTGTQNGVRIKSWGRPSTGFARNILFQHVVNVNVQNPIVIDQNYCPGNKGCPGQVIRMHAACCMHLVLVGDLMHDLSKLIHDLNLCCFACIKNVQVSGVKISNVIYQDIHGTSATQVAVKFDCSSKYPCSGIKLEDVKLTYKDQAAEASCKYAGGTTAGTVEPISCL